MPKVMVVPVFIPHWGCGFRCVFCDQHKISGQDEPPKPEELALLVADYRASCRDSSAAEVQLAFYGGSFTGIAAEMQEAYLQAAWALKAQGEIAKIRLSTRPDYIDEAVIDRLRRYEVDIVELGVQSLDEDVLTQSRRGHDGAAVYAAVDKLRAAGLGVGLQMMLALPGDTAKKAVATAAKLVALAPDFVRIYPTVVLRGTELAQMYADGRYVPWTLEEVVDTAARCAACFDAAGIAIVRIGLQDTERLRPEGDWLAGAYHPALGELVRARQKRQRLEAALAGVLPAGAVTVFCPPAEMSQFIGQKKGNSHYLSQKYGVPFAFVADKALGKGEFRLQIGEEADGCI